MIILTADTNVVYYISICVCHAECRPYPMLSILYQQYAIFGHEFFKLQLLHNMFLKVHILVVNELQLYHCVKVHKYV